MIVLPFPQINLKITVCAAPKHSLISESSFLFHYSLRNKANFITHAVTNWQLRRNRENVGNSEVRGKKGEPTWSEGED